MRVGTAVPAFAAETAPRAATPFDGRAVAGFSDGFKATFGISRRRDFALALAFPLAGPFRVTA